MSQYWPPDDPESSQQGRSRPLYGPPSQGYGRPNPNQGPPSQRRGRPNPDYGPPSQRPYGGGGWPPSEADQWPPQAPDEDPRGDSRYAQYPQNPQYPQYPEQSQYPQYPQYQQNPQYGQYSQYSQYGQYQQSPYAGDPYGSPYGYGPPAAEPRQGSNWLLPVVLVVLLVMVGAGAAGAYALTHRGPHGTSTASTSFRTYTDTATHVQFKIPQDWSTTGNVSATGGLQVLSPDQNSGLLVRRYSEVLDSTKAADGALMGGAGSSGSVANKAGPTNVSLAGETWVQESGDVTRDGATLHAVMLVTTHHNSTYLLSYVSLASSFNSANTTYFQPILKSFVFTQ